MGKWWVYVMKYVIPVEVAVLLGWWVLIVPITSGNDQWWNPFHAESIATCIMQWSIGIGLCYGINHVYLRREEYANKLPPPFRRLLTPIAVADDATMFRENNDADANGHDGGEPVSDMDTVQLSEELENPLNSPPR
jgi:hypothetical protein